MLIWATSRQHLIICINVLKNVPLKIILRYLYFKRNLANMGYFRPSLANFLNQNASYWLNLWLIDPIKIPMGSLDWVTQNLGICGYIWRKNVLRSQILLQTKILWLSWSFSRLLSPFFSLFFDKILTCQNNWPH